MSDFKKEGKALFLIAIISALSLAIATQGISTSLAQTTNGGNNTGGTNSSATGAANETSTTAAVPDIMINTENVTVTVTPQAQQAGKTVLVQARGFAPLSNTTITVDNELAANTQTDGNGTLLYALGIPENITRVETRTDNSTGQNTTRDDTHAWEGTVNIFVQDLANNRGSADLTILDALGQPTGNATATNNNNNMTSPGNNNSTIQNNNNNNTAASNTTTPSSRNATNATMQ